MTSRMKKKCDCLSSQCDTCFPTKACSPIVEHLKAYAAEFPDDLVFIVKNLEDVEEGSCEWIAGVIGHIVCSRANLRDRNADLLKAVYDATHAERERCAQIAEAMSLRADRWFDDTTCQQIAAALRSQEGETR